MAISFKGAHFPQEVILMGVRWYLAYPLSTRHVEELMEERGVELDHATINRWVIKYSPLLEEAFHRRKRPVRTVFEIVLWGKPGRERIRCGLGEFAQYVRDQPTTVMVSTSSSMPVLTRLNVLPWPSR